ncbi:NYN domain-containing protein [Legionella spiritensis]|uniref:NYN domain protein n=1 Tax=Legionella spiritensis TaxID=452 RepID=A0A0W0YX39_LEGSP|nr:NYN domain-containing protein [Legionella spiritensis]KTD61447.1 NYN domain protein [Legionella spiritensis]SNV33884.1 Maebl [Legionella spiritensis]
MTNKNITDESTPKLAVLIDADNARATNIEYLLTEIASYGEAIVKRIYGDFTSPSSAQWKKVLHTYAIKPVQQFAFTKGKNATDSALIIDAMDLLYTNRFNGFCIVSSDSDFTSLANRIREEGLLVYGIGEKKTPDAFRNACNKFIFTEILCPEKPKATKFEKDSRKTGNILDKPAKSKSTSPEFPKDFILEALNNSCDDSGWAYLGKFGSYLTKLKPDFDARLYGFKKLSDLVRGNPEIFDIEERTNPASLSKELYIRSKI